jgi:predicted phage tail protein
VSTDVLRTIKFYGPLAAKFGHVHRLAVTSVAEANRALSMVLPGYEKFMMESKDNGLVFAVHVGRVNIGEEDLRDYVPSDDEIRIVPVVIGSKKNGVMQTIVGAVMIVVGVILTFTPAAGLSPYLIQGGIGLMAAGIVQLLIPTPKNKKSGDKADNQSSDVFNGAVNTQAQGGPVPALYGELIVGSAVISAGISATDNYIVPTPSRSGPGYVSGGGGYGGNVIERYNDATE